MAHNLPVVSTNVGGLPEVIIDKKTGYVINKCNHKLFAEKILLLLNDKSICSKMGKEGNKRYNTFFKANIMSENYKKLIIC